MEVQGRWQPTWSWECFHVYLCDFAAETAIFADLHDYVHIDPKNVGDIPSELTYMASGELLLQYYNISTSQITDWNNPVFYL